MKIKLSDYLADFFVENGIKTIFTVVGGGAMHMNDSFGHHSKLQCVYNHHEQASAMAAEAYFRINNEMAGVCVTSGPGAINALNGVAGAYQDSIPMIVVSGQCKSSLMASKHSLNIRSLGPQEFDIVSSLNGYTKYAKTVYNPEDIRYELEKAFYIAKNGRPGPCWLEIPVDIQGSFVEREKLAGYNIKKNKQSYAKISDRRLDELVSKIRHSERPVLYVGNGVRISGAVKELKDFVHWLKIPVVTCWDSIDIIETKDDCYVGRGGTMGDRPGNFAVQNSDLLIAIGNRLNVYQVGYQIASWARNAYVVMIDIDSAELEKPTIRVDLPICMDVKDFLTQLKKKLKGVSSLEINSWREKCCEWKSKYPVVTEQQRLQEKPLNVYGVMDYLSSHLPEKSVTVVSNGSASVVGSAAYFIGKNQRFLMNCAISSMGYELPAAIGASVALHKGTVICIAGDGSIMMNLQELQTIITNHLPVKIILINNSGYHQIRQTQINLFDSKFVGIGLDSGDLSFPSFEKIAYAFGIPYKRCSSLSEQNKAILWMNEVQEACMIEMVCDTEQGFEPKSKAKKMADGSLYSPPLEDMAPFLSREELQENMYIPLWSER